MESTLSVRLLYGPYPDVVLSSSLFFLCYWPFACSIVLPLLLALLLFADSTPRYNHITSVHVVTQNNERFHNHANLSRKFTKPLSFVKLEPLDALVFNFTRS